MTTTLKAERFDEFLLREQIGAFDVKRLDDDDRTSVYRSYISTALGNMDLFVILDDTVYATIRLVVGPHAVTADNRADALAFANRANGRFKSFKYYVEEVDDTLYLDCIYMSADSEFRPELLYVLMNQIVQYIPTVESELLAMLGPISNHR